MLELISSILFIGSAAGLATIVIRKMPQAKQTLELSSEFKLVGFFETAKKALAARIRKNPRFRDFSWLDFAQKILLKGRVVALKVENKINDYMVKLRQRAEEQQKKDGAILDNYWHDLKTIVKTSKNSKTGVKDQGADPAEFDAQRAALREAVRVAVEPAKNQSGEMISKVALPEQVSSRPLRQKKKHVSKKKRFNDPFRW